MNFKNWVNWEVSKVVPKFDQNLTKIWPKFDFHSQFSMSQIIRIFPIFFSLNNINLGAYFLNIEIFWQLQFLKQFIGNLIFVYLKRWHFHKLNVNDTRYVSVGLLTSSIICVCICAVCLQPIFLRSRTSVFWDKSLWTKNLKIHSFCLLEY